MSSTASGQLRPPPGPEYRILRKPALLTMVLFQDSHAMRFCSLSNVCKIWANWSSTNVIKCSPKDFRVAYTRERRKMFLTCCSISGDMNWVSATLPEVVRYYLDSQKLNDWCPIIG